jgi:hypothetical protein
MAKEEFMPNWESEESKWSPSLEAYKNEQYDFVGKLEGLPPEIIDEIYDESASMVAFISTNTGIKDEALEADIAETKKQLNVLRESPRKYFEDGLALIESDIADDLIIGTPIEPHHSAVAEKFARILNAFKNRPEEAY